MLKKIFLFGSIALLIYSCDPEATDIYEVDNQSDWKILVGYKQDVDTVFTLKPKELKIIYINYYLGGADEKLDDDFLYCLDSLYIDVNDTLKIEMDYLQRKNWNCKITSGNTLTGNGGTARFTLKITNNDIVRKLE